MQYVYNYHSFPKIRRIIPCSKEGVTIYISCKPIFDNLQLDRIFFSKNSFFTIYFSNFENRTIFEQVARSWKNIIDIGSWDTVYDCNHALKNFEKRQYYFLKAENYVYAR